MIKEAIILSGGQGSRLQSHTKNIIPKGLAEVQGQSILYWCIHWLARSGVRKVIIAVGHLSEVIQQNLGDSIIIDNNSIEIIYSLEESKLGSGGAVSLASKYIDGDHVIIMNGDILTNINIDDMIDQHLTSNMDATMLLVNLRTRYGVVEIRDNIITEFREKPTLPHYIHAGVDILKTPVLSRFPKIGQMEETIFIDLAQEGQFGAFVPQGEYYWEAIDTPKELKEANKNWIGF